MNILIKSLLLCCSSIFFLGCEEGTTLPADPELRDYSAQFSALPEQALYPEDNLYSAEKELLGELLFWDPILSGGENVACASCHHPDFGWADGISHSIGSDGVGLGPNRYGNEVTPVHSPTIMNTAFTGFKVTDSEENFVAGPYFWDLRAENLEQQASGPIKNTIEMLGYNYHEEEIMPEIVMRLNTIGEYVYLFEQAFGIDAFISEETITQAIATFQRKVISPNSRFDQFLNGDTDVFTTQEIVALNKFIDGGCADCHNGPLLSDNSIDEDKKILTNLDAVRTPSLRNITKTAPYMQDGSRASLASAISTYEERGDLGVSAGEGDFAELEIFLNTLNSPVYSKIPDVVPSGLPVGGDIQ